MAFSVIDATKPAGTDKKKFGDDQIREIKQQTIDNLTEITNYPASTKTALRTAIWTTALRPTGDELVDRVTGYNTTLGYEEYYDLASTTWKHKSGIGYWSVAGRPTTLTAGLTGYNTDLAVIERYSGTAWARIAGGRRGDIKMWSGAVTDIETGWVLANGVARTHPEGGTYTPPNLMDRFIVGAGSGYGVGVTGGEATHTLSWDEMPAHTHAWSSTACNTSAGAGTSYIATGTNNVIGTVSVTTASAGGNAAHENRPPYYSLCYLYKL